jgi:hypothetical protein
MYMYIILKDGIVDSTKIIARGHNPKQQAFVAGIHLCIHPNTRLFSFFLSFVCY